MTAVQEETVVGGSEYNTRQQEKPGVLIHSNQPLMFL
jgi:hypothetical protein